MPAIPYPVELGLTVLHTALYASLFLFAYLQLWLLLCYGEKRLSYRPLGLSLCLLWAALRTVLFSCYLQNSLRAGPLQRQPFPHWLLFCSPGCLLFASLCLLNLYFAEGPVVSGLHIYKPSLSRCEFNLCNAYPWRCPRESVEKDSICSGTNQRQSLHSLCHFISLLYVQTCKNVISKRLPRVKGHICLPGYPCRFSSCSSVLFKGLL
nr:integral membrane protein GPR137C [Chelonoidis abingdonii]